MLLFTGLSHAHVDMKPRAHAGRLGASELGDWACGHPFLATRWSVPRTLIALGPIVNSTPGICFGMDMIYDRYDIFRRGVRYFRRNHYCAADMIDAARTHTTETDRLEVRWLTTSHRVTKASDLSAQCFPIDRELAGGKSPRKDLRRSMKK
jgi:hypothetical protein